LKGYPCVVCSPWLNTVFIYHPQDIHQQARIIRPPGLTSAVDATLATQLALVRKIKSKSAADRDVDLSRFMMATSTGPETGNEKSGDNTTVLKAHAAAVALLKKICLGYTIRRTGSSKGPDGQPLSGALPPLTIVHCVLTLAPAEVEQSRAKEQEAPRVNEDKLERAKKQDVRIPSA
jgi:hypothetical protein